MDSEDLLSRISYRTPKPEDIEACYTIEIASYPSDEAATLDRLRYRQSQAGEYFQCAFIDGKEMIGFVCATRCIEFEETSMSTHTSTGPLLAIHSVVLKEEYRRKGIATAMLKTYAKYSGVQRRREPPVHCFVVQGVPTEVLCPLRLSSHSRQSNRPWSRTMVRTRIIHGVKSPTRRRILVLSNGPVLVVVPFLEEHKLIGFL